MSNLTDKYDEFLDSQCPWTHYICNVCGNWSTHPLNYCTKCPGKIIHFKITWLDHIKLYRQKTRIIDMCTREAGLKIPYPSDAHDILFTHLKERINGN